jgi:hypothetical protein
MPRNKRRETINKQTKAARVHYQTNIAQLSTSLAQSKRALDKNTRILSMSLADLSDASPDERASILMWSHYAKHHSGVRIGLDLAILTGANCFVRPVLYSDERPTHDWSVSANIEHKEFVQTVIQTKSRAWSYEKEIRLFVLPNYCTADSLADGTPASFLVFEPAAILRVDFGLLMPQDQQNECLAVLSAAYPHVTVFSAKYHPTQYALDYEQIR